MIVKSIATHALRWHIQLIQTRWHMAHAFATHALRWLAHPTDPNKMAHAFLQQDGLGSSSIAFKHAFQAAFWSSGFLDLSLIALSTLSAERR